MDTAIFSETWHRVAPLHLELRAAVEVRRQYFRGEKWFLIHDPFRNAFFRVRPEAWQFVARLSRRRTVAEVWQECLSEQAEEPPTQPEVIRLLAQLYQANLLQADLPPETATLLTRKEKGAKRPVLSVFSSLLSLRLPLGDPDPLLRRLVAPFGWIVSRPMAVLWLIVVGVGLTAIAGQWSQMRAEAALAFAPDNLLLLYVSFFVAKTIHEFGHGFVCRVLGGEVHRLGVMFVVFTPMPYVDATSSWSFRRRRERILVSAAGMLFELFFAALAALLWTQTAPGTLHRFCANFMVVASVSTLLFNINPLLKFDGYYILSDWLDTPNLTKRAQDEVRFVFERWVCGARRAVSGTTSPLARLGLACFGVAGGLYRTLLGFTIVLYIGSRFFELGLLLAGIYLLIYTVGPLVRGAKYLARAPGLAPVRRRAWTVSVGAVAIVLTILAMWPWPRRFQAPGIVEAEHFAELHAPTDGFLVRTPIRSGDAIAAGTTLVVLRNAELEQALLGNLAEQKEIAALADHALSAAPGSLAPLEARLGALRQRYTTLEQQQETLTVRAPQSGTWVAPRLSGEAGAWLARGTLLGELVDLRSVRFCAVVSQTEAAALFGHGLRDVEVRLRGEAGRAIVAHLERIVPAQQAELPSAALGWRGGGEVAVDERDPSGRRTAEPYFKVIASLDPGEASALHRRSGSIRFEFAAEPLLRQWWRRALQEAQRRYRI